jgi:putative ABC transport system permease protein
MNLWMCFQIGLREIWEHRFRSMLSMLGIVLGVSSLIATLSLTAGMEAGTRELMRQMGGLESVTIEDNEISNEQMDFWSLSPGRTIMDAEAIKDNVPLVSRVSPQFSSSSQVSADSGVNDRFRVMGVWPDYLQIANHQVLAGRFLSALDVDMATKSVVIGYSVAQQMFPNKQPWEAVGELLRIDEVPFQVVGVFEFYERDQDRRRRELGVDQRRRELQERRGTRQGRWDPLRRKNQVIVIPYSTMFYEFQSGRFPMDSVDTVRMEELNIQVSDLERFDEALDQVRRTLDVTHRGVQDFGFETREEWFGQMEAGVRATRLSGGLIAGIALLVGGNGITNIMLASISERVREIGIRMAVGARGRDVFLQILVESTSISIIGGIIGILAGAALIQVLVAIAPEQNMPILTPESIIISVTFAVLAGVFSGIYPAVRASRLDPIQALRYE